MNYKFYYYLIISFFNFIYQYLVKVKTCIWFVYLVFLLFDLYSCDVSFSFLFPSLGIAIFEWKAWWVYAEGASEKMG